MRLLEMQLMSLDRIQKCSIFVLMMHGYPLTANLPEEIGLGERFWYWRGASGQSYIHSIYPREHCPPVPGAVFVLVRKSGGVRHAVCTGRFGLDGALPVEHAPFPGSEDEVHVHLLARDGETAACVLRDLEATMEAAIKPVPEIRAYRKPVQLDLLAA